LFLLDGHRFPAEKTTSKRGDTLIGESKKDILREFFSIEGNHEIEKLYAFKNKYLQNPDWEVWSDLQVSDVVKINEMYIIEHGGDDFNKTREIGNDIINNIWERDWDFLDLKLASCAAGYADDFGATCLEIIDELEKYKDKKSYQGTKATTILNFLFRLMRENRTPNPDPELQIDHTTIRLWFIKHYNMLMEMPNDGIEEHKAAAMIRKGIVFDVDELAAEGFEILIKRNQPEIARLILKEVEKYGSFESLNAFGFVYDYLKR